MSEFYDHLKNIELLLEKKRKRTTTSKTEIEKKSELGRKKRSKNVEISDIISKTKDGYTEYTANATSQEKTESDIHKCLIKKRGKKIDNVSCSCSDFQARYQYHRNKDSVSLYNKVKPIKDIFNPHTKEEPKIMNPNNSGYLCKHLLAFIKKINETEA